MRIKDRVKLRPASDSDYDFGYDVKKAALREYVDQTWGWDEEEQKGYYRREFDLRHAHVITLDGEDVGWLVHRRTHEGQEVHQLFILPSYQNQGIGTHLLETIIASACQQELAVFLQVLKCNVRARKLYERLGFEIYEERTTHLLMKREGSPK